MENKNTFRQSVMTLIVNFLIVFAIFALFLVLINAGVINYYYEGIIILIFIYIVFASSLNFVTGFLGELALGHAGFIAIGAYTAALTTQNMNLSSWIQFPISLILGGLLAGVFGFLIGIPALRLRGDYLGIITLGFGEMIRVAIFNLEGITRGAKGITRIPFYSTFAWTFWVMVITVFVIYRLIKSRHGRAILAIRENEIAAEAVGIKTFYYKIITFTISAFFAGVGGGLFAHYMQMIDPKKFTFLFSVEILIIVVLGGMGSLTGTIVAATVLTILPEALRIGEFETYRLLIYSLLLIIMMIFRPEGLIGRHEFSIQALKNKLFGKKKEVM